MDGFPIPHNIENLEVVSFYPGRYFLDNNGAMVHTRKIIIRERIQPDGKRDISVYKKHSTYLNTTEGEVFIIARCYGWSRCGSTFRFPAHPGPGGAHPHFLSGGACDGRCNWLGMAEYGAAQTWLLWKDLVNVQVRAAVLEGLETMPSLNGPIRHMAENLGIVAPTVATMHNQARFQARWLFGMLRDIGIGPFPGNLFDLLAEFEPEL